MGISEYDRANVQLILRGHGDWFSAELLRLIAKADSANREKLRLAFPDAVKAWEDWYRG